MSKIDILKRYYHYYGMKMLLLKLFRNHSAENFDYDSWLKKNATNCRSVSRLSSIYSRWTEFLAINALR